MVIVSFRMTVGRKSNSILFHEFRNFILSQQLNFIFLNVICKLRNVSTTEYLVDAVMEFGQKRKINLRDFYALLMLLDSSTRRN